MALTTMHGQLLEKLGMEITGGRPPPGAVLRIEDLEDRFRASRTVVREAVRVLESMQLVTSRRRVGVTVQDHARWNVYDPRVIRWRLAGPDRQAQLQTLSELRKAVEPLAARAAAERATRAQRTELVALGERLHRAGTDGDMDDFIAADAAFHALVLAASGNEMFAALADVLAEVVSGLNVYTLIPRRPHRISLKLHLQAAHAVQAGDAALAEAAIRKVIDRSSEQIRRALGAGSLPAPAPQGARRRAGQRD